MLFFVEDQVLTGSGQRSSERRERLSLVLPGTYDIEHISFSITNAAPGVYTFYTTTGNPRPSIVTDQDFNDNDIPQASFSITIVPEPTSLALLLLSGTALTLFTYLRRTAPSGSR